jgi:hypothetical protein
MIVDRDITRIVEAIDWMTKYFIVASMNFLFLSFFSIFVKEQKVNVLTSRTAQIKIHEFLNMHRMMDVNKVNKVRI